MKKLVLSSLFVLGAVFALPSSVRADGCYLCGSGSPCAQCRYGASDTSDARKACEKKGCKISGTASCSTAANVKVCAAPPPAGGPQTALAQPDIPWCVAG